ncbi:hypothetical protein Vafri_10730 [Volvox africanus]|uniref:Uncharacterized protein n=1 Tax=Volvox africanus TaxID=51714 RepID=A0A8J4B6J6_9CHLO|nr:hypothetical protein Vafri_10730 [Volvox africanus]
MDAVEPKVDCAEQDSGAPLLLAATATADDGDPVELGSVRLLRNEMQESPRSVVARRRTPREDRREGIAGGAGVSVLCCSCTCGALTTCTFGIGMAFGGSGNPAAASTATLVLLSASALATIWSIPTVAACAVPPLSRGIEAARQEPGDPANGPREDKEPPALDAHAPP